MSYTKTLLVVCFLILFCGCRLAIVKESEIFFLQRDVMELQEDVARLKRDVRDLSRGFSVVPVTVAFTNMTAESLMKEEN